MHQFFVDEGDIGGGIAVIRGGDAAHLKRSLRAREGERIRVSDGSGKSYFCEIADLGGEAVSAKILEEAPDTELSRDVYLFQGLPKGDKMELIIQKATELGARGVIPVAMRNCVARLDEGRARGKAMRWRAIARESAMQSKRSRIPDVYAPMEFGEAASQALKASTLIACYEGESGVGMEPLREALRAMGGPGAKGAVAVFIGPEGGFCEEEIAALRDGGARVVSLGRRILRTETAGIAALSLVMSHLEA